MMDWQPIETAPKDGVTVRLYGYGEQGIGYWWRNDWVPAHLLPSDEEPEFSFTATHWAPLPPPPLTGSLAPKTQNGDGA